MQLCNYVSMPPYEYATMRVCKYKCMNVSKYAGLHILKYQLCKYEIILTFSINQCSKFLHILISIYLLILVSSCHLCSHSWLTEIVRLVYSSNLIEWATGRGGTQWRSSCLRTCSCCMLNKKKVQ